jgi:hypothetical protein
MDMQSALEQLALEISKAQKWRDEAISLATTHIIIRAV